MKFGISCSIDSKILMDTGTQIQHASKSYTFYVDHETHYLSKVRIISEVTDPTRYFVLRNESTSETSYGYEQELVDELVFELQRLESTLGLAANLQSIKWDKPRLEWYPETTDECARVQMLPAWFFLHDWVPDEPTVANPQLLETVIKESYKIRDLMVPMAFFREGRNEYRAHRYINAFNSYFLVIEGLYSNGQYSQNGVIRELEKSTTFSRFVQELIDKAKTNTEKTQGLTHEQLQNLLKKRQQACDVPGLITFLVKERGSLHHFSVKSTRAQGNPFVHRNFKTVALVAMVLAGNCITEALNQAA